MSVVLCFVVILQRSFFLGKRCVHRSLVVDSKYTSGFSAPLCTRACSFNASYVRHSLVTLCFSEKPSSLLSRDPYQLAEHLSVHIAQGRRSSARIFWKVKAEKDRLLARYCRLLHITLHNPPQLLRFPNPRKSDKRVVRTALRHGI